MRIPARAWNLSASFVALAILWASPSAGQRAASQALHDTSWSIPANTAISELLAKRTAHSTVGIVVGVIEQGDTRVVAHGKSGSSDERPLDGDSVFQIGSEVFDLATDYKLRTTDSHLSRRKKTRQMRQRSHQATLLIERFY